MSGQKAAVLLAFAAAQYYAVRGADRLNVEITGVQFGRTGVSQ